MNFRKYFGKLYMLYKINFLLLFYWLANRSLLILLFCYFKDNNLCFFELNKLNIENQSSNF